MQNISRLHRLVFCSFILLFLCGCGGYGVTDEPVDDAPSAAAPVAVLSSEPPNGTSGVGIDARIQVVFSRPIDPRAVNSATFTVKDGMDAAVNGSVVCSGDWAVFTPANGFSYSSTYTATLTTGVKDLSGNPLGAEYSWQFSTVEAPDATPPSINSVAPGDNAVNVPLAATVTVTFNEAIDPDTVTSASFMLLDPNNLVVSSTAVVSGARAVLSPTQDLLYGAVYTAALGPSIADAAGNALGADYRWSFKTIDPPDTANPVIASTSPENGSTGVAVSARITATFSEPMDPATINESTFVVEDIGGNPISGSVSYSGMQASFTPATGFSYESGYRAFVTAGAADLAGNPVSGAASWGFRTALSPISGGRLHSLATKAECAWGWGYNGSGQLGDGTTIDRLTPVQTPSFGDIKSLRAGEFHTLSVRNDGTVWAWGRNDFGQLGDGTLNNRASPVQVSGVSGAVAVSGGFGTHSTALKSDGTVWAWGNNGFGQLGDGTLINRRRPVRVADLTGVAAVSEGWSHTAALKIDGTVWSWGRNTEGQLGNNSTTDSPVAVQAEGLTGVTAIAAGGRHTLALKNDGTVWSWGWNNSGQLGDNASIQRQAPAMIPGLGSVVALAAGYNHSAALGSDGTVWVWGDNTFGQLGGFPSASSPSPVKIGGLSGIVSVASGWSHLLALENGGSLWAWGYNYYGQLGDGSMRTSSTPVRVSGW